MASQTSAVPDYTEQEVPEAAGSAGLPGLERCRIPAVNGSQENSSTSSGPQPADVPVNGVVHVGPAESGPVSAAEACASQNGPEPSLSLNGFLPGRGPPAAVVSLQPNCLPCDSVNVEACDVARSNGNHSSSEDSVGVCVDQRVPELQSGLVSPELQKKGHRYRKTKRRRHTEEKQTKTWMNGLSQSDEEGNAGARSADSVLTCSGFSGYEHVGVVCNGASLNNFLPSSPVSDCRERYNRHADRQNVFPHHQNAPVERREEDADPLDMVDEGAVCDFDRNVFVDENSFSFSEDASTSACVASNNINGDYPNGHLPRDADDLGRKHQRRQVRQYYSHHFQYSSSDSDAEPAPGGVPDMGEDGGRVRLNENRQDAVEDNGDFIDADLPSVPGQLFSSSADSASLSSSNGDLAEARFVRFPSDDTSSRQANNLSVGSDKELNHRPESPDLQAVPDSAAYRTSYSSPSHDGGFDNFLAPHELSSSDGVFGNSSESENDEELSENLPLDGQDGVLPMFEGAGVAEAMASPHLNEQGPDGHPFGAVGDLCFHFDRACSLRENEWQPEHTASSMPPSYLAGQSAARHDSCPHLPLDPTAEEGEAGGACAPPLPSVNNLSRLHPVTPGVRAVDSMANGLDDVAPSNFINDECNRQQKVFVKFPMVQDGRDGACGSGAGHGKCEGDNVRCPCPCPGPQVSAYNSSGELGVEPDQGNLPGSLGPNVESSSGRLLSDYKRSTREMQWFANSESGVSEPIYEEINDYPACLSPECSVSHNALNPGAIKKGSRDGKKKRIVCRPIENGVDGTSSVDRMMIWNEYEAYLLQVKQIGMSACGQTAVLNLLKAFELPAEKKDVCSKIHVNFRKEKASVADYLSSRAVAGTTAEELLAGVERLTKGEIRGRFFHFWPPRDVQLLPWISQWMKKGAVPIATLNLQLGVKQQQVPDAWHHQMVYGVGPRGVYLTNPLEIVPEETMMEQLTSDSVLLVRRQDVVSRFQPSASLAPLMKHQDPRWCTMNVLGQVVNVLREHNMPSVPGYRAQLTSHIRIPAVYRAGIALYVRHNTDEWKALRDAPDLPCKSARGTSTD